MTKRPVPPKQLNPSAFKAQNMVFGQRLRERVLRAGDTDFILRSLTNRQMTYVQSMATQAEMNIWMVKLGVKAIKHEGYTAKFDEIELLGQTINVLSDEAYDELPPTITFKEGKTETTRPLPVTLAGMINALTTLSEDEVNKLDFFLPCENAT
jgi:hypothetical protein